MTRLVSAVLLLAACRPEPAPLQEATPNAADSAPAVVVAPAFDDYQAPDTFTGPPAPVDLSEPSWARTFRAVLRHGAETGPNFAGEFTIVTWGCGTECRQYAVVSARTGRVFADSVLDFSCHQPEYRLNSTLVIESGGAASRGPCGAGPTRFFRWAGEGFVPVQP
jgi:hypothetical protein